MKSKTLFIISIILLFIIIFSGCNNDNSFNDNSDTIDYTEYLNKIWIINDWDYESYRYSLSFFINSIEAGNIRGELSVGGITAMPAFYFYSFNSVKFCDFEGVIIDGTAECEFDDGEGNKGIISLNFGNNQIEAEIKFTSKKFPDLNNTADGIYIFEPYNLEHLSSSMINTFALTVDLNSWRIVNLVTTVIDGNKPYPTAFLTNEYGDILYQFGAYQVGSKITDVFIEDINEDGLKDVKIITDFGIEFLFLQMENGLFYRSALEL
ncbi:MAG: hypothetical protein FWD48_07275 [Oscillospiraceae bacterium]|nr:hypothetical protein [Oscillospiraceae bacterium]